MFLEILKKKWSTINFAVDTTHVANSSVKVDSEVLENLFKAHHEIGAILILKFLEMTMQSCWILFFVI